MMVNKHHDLAERVQVLNMIVLGYSVDFIVGYLSFSRFQIFKIRRKAIERRFDPIKSRIIQLDWVRDAPRSGRPTKMTVGLQEQVVQAVTRDRYGREKSAGMLAAEFDVSRDTILRILRRKGFQRVKPSRKPGLTQDQRAARLLFALRYADWTLEDWKRVVWTDETSVILGHQRGQVRIWRTAIEGRNPVIGTIRNRWKGFSEFMFWGAFSYDYKVSR